jgi:hypothetical protein
MESKTAYCGIDVGLKSHAVCLVNRNQQVIRKYKISNDINGLRKLEADIDRNTLVCLEPTGIYSVNIFLYFKRKGYDIKFCTTHSSFYFRQARFNKKKHDKLDSIALAKYRAVNDDLTFDGTKLIEKLALDDYEYDPDFVVLSDLVSQYLKKSKDIAVLKSKIKSVIDLRFPEAIQIFSCNRGCQTILKMLHYPKEDILQGYVKLEKLKEIQDRLRNSIGQYDLKVKDFKNYVKELNKLENDTKDLKHNIKELLCKKGYAGLFNYWGLDTVNISCMVTEIRDINRFLRYNQDGTLNKKKSLKAFKKFLGIAVTSNQSGEREGTHKLTKAGNMKLRSILFMLALRYIGLKQNNKDRSVNQDLNPYKFKSIYDRLLEKNHKKLVIITKIMDKIATDLFFILKNKVNCDS